MVKGEMTIQSKTSRVIHNEKEAAIVNYTEILSAPLDRARARLSGMLVTRGSALGLEAEDAMFARPVMIAWSGSGNGHSQVKKLEIDMEIVAYINEAVEGYRDAVKGAVSQLWLSIDAQSWEPNKCEVVLTAMQEDAKLHTDQIASLLEKSADGFSKCDTYDEVMAQAATLMLSISAVAGHINKHLYGVARQAELAYIRRKEK